MNEPFYKDLHNTLYCQDFRENDLPDELVQMVCTSPPYWGLRKYSGEQELIWGDKDCEHQWNAGVIKHDNMRYRGESSIVGSNRNEDIRPGPETDSNFCSLCGAWKGAYGLEPTPEMYIQHTIEILREIRRVLRKDGVVFWNIGDSYASSPPGHCKTWQHGNDDVRDDTMVRRSTVVSSLKPKDLCLIPFRLAIAAQEDGWWVRSVIIWSKPNPMPESVTDRPTESHEYILMLTKSARYYWDADAVREVSTGQTGLAVDFKRTTKEQLAPGQSALQHRADRKSTSDNGGRNIRSVWEFPTQPYPEAHFAVFPEKLPELCIKAATPEVGCCGKCGNPWTRVLSKGLTDHSAETESAYGTGTSANRLAKLRQSARAKGGEYVNDTETLGWQPTCKCDADKIPSIVLDPFAGAGTTLWMAKKLNRQAIGYEISEEYCQLAVERLRQQVLI